MRWWCNCRPRFPLPYCPTPMFTWCSRRWRKVILAKCYSLNKPFFLMTMLVSLQNGNILTVKFLHSSRTDFIFWKRMCQVFNASMTASNSSESRAFLKSKNVRQNGLLYSRDTLSCYHMHAVIVLNHSRNYATSHGWLLSSVPSILLKTRVKNL